MYQVRAVTEKRKIENYIETFGNRPFTQQQVRNETGCTPNTVQYNVRQMELAGKLKHIGFDKVDGKRVKIYIRTADQQKYPQKQYDFTPDRDKLVKIHDILKGKALSSNEIAINIANSKETVCRYLNVLLVLGAVAHGWGGKYRAVYCSLPPEFAAYSYYKKQLDAEKQEK